MQAHRAGACDAEGTSSLHVYALRRSEVGCTCAAVRVRLSLLSARGRGKPHVVVGYREAVRSQAGVSHVWYCSACASRYYISQVKSTLLCA